MTGAMHVLLVEDNVDDAFFFQRNLRQAGVTCSVTVAEDGEEALEYLSRTSRFSGAGPLPSPLVIFLDLKLPLKSGHDVLEWIRRSPPHQALPVVVLTASDEPVDRRLAEALGIQAYMVKPATSAQLAAVFRVLESGSNDAAAGGGDDISRKSIRT